MFWPRLRWRLRGAWMWPAFVALSLAEGAMLHELPIAGSSMPVLGGILLAAFLNLIGVALGGPLVGYLVRRRRRDLPKVVAENYAGTALVATIAIALLAAGLAHRPTVLAHRQADADQLRAASVWVMRNGPPAARANLGELSSLRLSATLFRTCVPDGTPRQALCLYVSTATSPPRVRVDPSRVPDDRFAAPGAYPGP